LYGFQSDPDGGTPEAGLTWGSDGALYGTTALGGSNGLGAVFKLVPPLPGQTVWNETVLHSFIGATSDGADPVASVLVDSDLNIFGTTAEGGNKKGVRTLGTVFEVTQ
jgi:uncharacterized repeat protein (TIGR03803 family)